MTVCNLHAYTGRDKIGSVKNAHNSKHRIWVLHTKNSSRCRLKKLILIYSISLAWETRASRLFIKKKVKIFVAWSRKNISSNFNTKKKTCDLGSESRKKTEMINIIQQKKYVKKNRKNFEIDNKKYTMWYVIFLR